MKDFMRETRKSDFALVPWGGSDYGKLPKLETLFGLQGAAVTAAEISRGIALEMGFFAPEIPGATGETDTDLKRKTEIALQMSHKYPLVFLHVNGADEASHRRNPQEKAVFLNRLDREMIQPLAQAGNLLVCSDHGSSPITGKHIGGEQPFALWDRQHKGALGTINGNESIRLLTRGNL